MYRPPEHRIGVIETISLFVAEDWLDHTQLRQWVKQTLSQMAFVLITDDFSTANAVLLRELRCSGIVVGVVRTPGSQQSALELASARFRRDSYMAAHSKHIFDFGRMPGGPERFGRPVTVEIL